MTLVRPPGNDPFAPTVATAGPYAATIVLSTLWTYGFILLFNERLLAESREANERLELVFKNSPDAALITRVSDGRFVAVSDGFSALTGYGEAEVLGSSTLQLELWQRPEDRAQVIERLRAQSSFHELAVALRRKDGRPIVGMLSAKRIDFHGEPHILSVTRDVTEQKRAEQELRANREFLHDLIENNAALIFVKSRAGRYELVNKQWEQTTGLSRERVIGKTDAELFPGAVGLGFREVDSKVVDGDVVIDAEELLEDATGKRYFHSVKFPLHDEAHAVRGLCGIATDITERKRAEEAGAKLIVELGDALASVKTLRGFIPICAACKKIRNDEGYWQQVEVYVRDHTEAEFSHGVCPECIERLYPDCVDPEHGG